MLLTSSIMMSAIAGPAIHTPGNGHAASPARLEVWSPLLHSSNITAFSLTPGNSFTVMVNVTGAGPITTFDVTLFYNLVGPGVVNATGGTMAGGAFDQNNPPPGCQILPLASDVFGNLGRVRFSAGVLGSCTADGNNANLFTVTFNVLKINATTIDIAQTDHFGRSLTLLGERGVSVPYTPVGAYFRNAHGNPSGVPPIADFTFTPPKPVVQDSVKFNATGSYDPDNSTRTGKGIRQFLWEWGDATSGSNGALTNHVFTFPPNLPGNGKFSVTLVVWDYEGLPARKTMLVDVTPSIRHDLAVQLMLDKYQYNVGDTVPITAIVSNRGNRDELANMTVTYDYQGITPIGSESQVGVLRDQSLTYKYQISTGNLPARAYTVTAKVVIVYNNSTGRGVIPDDNPENNIVTTTFTLNGPSTASFVSLPLIGGLAVALIGAGYVAVRVLRRGKREV